MIQPSSRVTLEPFPAIHRARRPRAPAAYDCRMAAVGDVKAPGGHGAVTDGSEEVDEDEEETRGDAMRRGRTYADACGCTADHGEQWWMLSLRAVEASGHPTRPIVVPGRDDLTMAGGGCCEARRGGGACSDRGDSCKGRSVDASMRHKSVSVGSFDGDTSTAAS